jgi:hypothetical protein
MTNPSETTEEIDIPEPEIVSTEVAEGPADGAVNEVWIEELDEREDGATDSRLMVRNDT